MQPLAKLQTQKQRWIISIDRGRTQTKQGKNYEQELTEVGN